MKPIDIIRLVAGLLAWYIYGVDTMILLAIGFHLADITEALQKTNK